MKRKCSCCKPIMRCNKCFKISKYREFGYCDKCRSEYKRVNKRIKIENKT